MHVGVMLVTFPGSSEGRRRAGPTPGWRSWVAPVASASTPVPGGVGAMTVARLLSSTLPPFERSSALSS